jgi:hypothetical protein
MRSSLTSIEADVIDALTREDLVICLSVLGDDCVSAITARRPEFMDLLPWERRNQILDPSPGKKAHFAAVVEELSEHDVPSDAAAVISAVMDGVVAYSEQEREAKSIGRLDELVGKWRGRNDPVASAMTAGNERLESLLRSRWRQTDTNLSDDRAVWSDRISWEGVGPAFASAAQVVPERFMLELGFSIGVRIAERESEPSEAQIRDELKKVGLEPVDSIVGIVMPMVE